MIVPLFDLTITNGPVDRDAFLRIRPEIEIAPAVALPAPHQRASANVIATPPIERLLLHVGTLLLRGEHMHVDLLQNIVAPQHGMRGAEGDRRLAAMRNLPRRRE